MEETFSGLTFDDYAVLEELNAEFTNVNSNRRKGRYRQTFRVDRRYTRLKKQFEGTTLHAHFAREALRRASEQACKQARERGGDGLLPEPTDCHVEWWHRKLKRDYKEAVRKTLLANDEARGITPEARRLMNDANRKLRKSAESYQSGKDRPKKNNVERKLMSPEEKKAHDRRLETENRRRRRAKSKQPLQTRSVDQAVSR